jgi:hypothetical protein
MYVLIKLLTHLHIFTINKAFQLQKHASGYKDFLRSLFERIEEEEEDQLVQSIKTSKAMFEAAKSGNIIILDFIFNYNPNLFMEVNSKGQSILHIAILYRKGSVYRLIFKKGSYKNVLVQHIDHKGNNILHLAGKFTVEERFGSPTHQALICSEELWFKVHYIFLTSITSISYESNSCMSYCLTPLHWVII